MQVQQTFDPVSYVEEKALQMVRAKHSARRLIRSMMLRRLQTEGLSHEQIESLLERAYEIFNLNLEAKRGGWN